VALWVQVEMLISIQKALVQTFKYSPLLVLTVPGLSHHGLLRFIWKLLGEVVLVAVLAAVMPQVEQGEAVVAHLPDNYSLLNL